MDWFLYDNGLRHERVKPGFYTALFLNSFSYYCVKNYLLQALSEIGTYLYAGSTCISYKYKDFEGIEERKLLFFFTLLWACRK